MRKIKDLNQILKTKDKENKVNIKKEINFQLPLDLSTILAEFNESYNFLSNRYIFNTDSPNIKNFKQKPAIQFLKSDYIAEYDLDLRDIYNLKDFTAKNHAKLNLFFLNNESLENLKLEKIDLIFLDGILILPSLISLTIVDSKINLAALKSLLTLNLKELFLENLNFDFDELNFLKCLENCNLKKFILKNEKFELLNELYKDNYNYFEVKTTNSYIKIDFTVNGNRNVILISPPKIFYTFDYSDAISFELDDENILDEEFYNLKIFKIRNLSINYIHINNWFYQMMDKLYNLSFLKIKNAKIDFNILSLILETHKMTLKYLDLKNAVLPYDFINMCKNILNDCVVYYGLNKSFYTGNE